MNSRDRTVGDGLGSSRLRCRVPVRVPAHDGYNAGWFKLKTVEQGCDLGLGAGAERAVSGSRG